MIYVNGKLKERVQKKDSPDFDANYEKFWKDFEEAFKDNLTHIGTIRVDKPIIIKYKEGLEVPDPNNEGKFLSPASISLSFRAKAIIGKGQVEVRYAADAPNIDKSGNFIFHANGTEVNRRMSIMDVDLAFFLYSFSEEMAANGKGIVGKNANFQIENPELERRNYVRNKQEQATFEMRLFNDVEEGGLSENILRHGAKMMGIIDADRMNDVNQLRMDIERLVKNKKELRKTFLDATNAQPSVVDENYADRKQIVVNAIDRQLIVHDKFNNQFKLNDENGKATKVLFNYKVVAAQEGNKKVKKDDLLHHYLEETNPALIDEWELRIRALDEAKELEAKSQVVTA